MWFQCREVGQTPMYVGLITHSLLMSHFTHNFQTVADSKGGGGGGRPYWRNFFAEKPPFPCKRLIDRCVHFRQMRTGLINCFPLPLFLNFLDPPLLSDP